MACLEGKSVLLSLCRFIHALLTYNRDSLRRGMGATTRAAKGFVSNRIETKSYFQVSVDAPTIRFPIDVDCDSGICCRLGKSHLCICSSSCLSN
jgi:hypothetical protein